MTDHNDTFAALMQQSETTPVKKIKPGQQLNATIVGIDKETLFLDVGGKSEGLIETAEFRDETGELSVAIGDSINVYCLRISPSEQWFTTRLGSGASSAHLEEAWRSGVPVEGVVKAEIKGGFEITLSGSVRAFCPYSQMGLRRVDNPAEHYLGERMTFLISRFEELGRNIVVSSRAVQERELEQKKEELRETLAEGQVISGTVSSLRQFGLFVDIGGIDGLVPLSEIGWSRVEDLTQNFFVGQSVSVKILSLDWEKERISLSIKETLADPWEQAASQFGQGTTHLGSIARLAPFGAFITLAPGIDGLLHISKLGQGKKINHPREVVEAGQQIEVVIESIDTEERKISLAPADYISEEVAAQTEQRVVEEFRSRQQKPAKSNNLGSFGALLKAKMDEKKADS